MSQSWASMLLKADHTTHWPFSNVLVRRTPTASSDCPCDLWIVSAHASCSGSCVRATVLYLSRSMHHVCGRMMTVAMSPIR